MSARRLQKIALLTHSKKSVVEAVLAVDQRQVEDNIVYCVLDSQIQVLYIYIKSEKRLNCVHSRKILYMQTICPCSIVCLLWLA